MPSEFEYLSPEQYAKRFNVPVRTVYRWCANKVLATLPRKGTRLLRIVVGPAERGEVQARQDNVLLFQRRSA